MKIFILFSLAFLMSTQVRASLSCVISRGGNEFWIDHYPNGEICETTAKVKFQDKKGNSRLLQFQFLTHLPHSAGSDSTSMILLTIDNQEPIQLNTSGLFSLVQNLDSGELLLMKCNMNNQEKPPVKTNCTGFTSYPTAPEFHKTIDNVDKWTEEIPEGLK